MAIVKLKKKEEDVLYPEQVTSNHIVVGIVNGNPCMLNKGFSEPSTQLTFRDLTDHFVTGNGYRYTDEEDSIKTMIEWSIKGHGSKIAAFPQKDWKQALQWLIDNA